MDGPPICVGQGVLDLRGFEEDQVHRKDVEIGDCAMGVLPYLSRPFASALERESMTSISFSDITGRIAKWIFPERIDAVLAIATGGVVPGALVAMRLGVELRLIALNY